MCGICGIYRTNQQKDDLSIIHSMMDRMVHRGPDDSGCIHDGSVTLGHQRLSILDLTSAGRQPMRSACGRFVIVFNGEIYNFQNLRREMGIQEEALNTRTDTEIILHLWRREGWKMLPRMVGQWAFAIYDSWERCCYLTRDRFGEKPLFYHEHNGVLSFASSIKALLAVPWITRDIAPDSMVQLLALRYVVAPDTVISGIKKLPAGHYMKIDASGSSIHRWYTIPNSDEGRFFGRRIEDLLEEFDHLLRQAVSRCCVSDVPVGLFLSDGLDSNSIRAVMKDNGTECPAFTYVPRDEVKSSGYLIEATRGAELIEVSRAEQFSDIIQALGTLNEPVGDGVALATWQLVQRARSRATVFLCGHGGDELLAGYRFNKDLFRLRMFRRASFLPPSILPAVTRKYLYGIEPFRDRWVKLTGSSRSSIPGLTRYLIHHPLSFDEMQQMFQGTADLTIPARCLDRFYRETNAFSSDLDRMQHVTIQTFLTENLLVFADSVSMDNSAEIRLPFLDRDLADFILSIPDKFRARSSLAANQTKIILRKWGKTNLNSQILYGKKRGFTTGNMSAFLHEFGSEIKDYILGVTTVREIFPGIEDWLNNPPEYFRRNRVGTLWAILAFSVWYENLDQAGCRTAS